MKKYYVMRLRLYIFGVVLIATNFHHFADVDVALLPRGPAPGGPHQKYGHLKVVPHHEGPRVFRFKVGLVAVGVHDGQLQESLEAARAVRSREDHLEDLVVQPVVTFQFLIRSRLSFNF